MPGPGGREYTAYASRFTALGIFSIASFLSAVMWICLAPVATIAEDGFGVDNNGLNSISLVFMILYLPASILAMWLMEGYGLRTTLLVGIALDALGCGAKWAGVAATTGQQAYAVVLFGQILGGMGQPLILNVPARVSMDWFPQRERDLATVAATMSNVLGQMIGSLLPPYLVNTFGDLRWLMLAQFVANAALLLIAFVCLKERAPSPPSAAAAAQWSERDVNDARAHAWQAFSQLFKDVRVLLRSRNFNLLLGGFSVATGMAWTLLTVQAQIIQPCGYDNTVAGDSAASLLGVGVVASFIVGFVMERTKAFVLLQKLTMVASTAAAVFALAVNKPGSAGLVMGAWCVLGAVLQPLLPVALETAAETTYPVSADASSSVLLIGANLVGTGLTYALGDMLNLPVSANCTSVYSPSALLVVICMGVGTIMILFMTVENRRQAAEALQEEKHASSDATQALLLHA